MTAKIIEHSVEICFDQVPALFDEKAIEAIRPWSMAIWEGFDDHLSLRY